MKYIILVLCSCFSFSAVAQLGLNSSAAAKAAGMGDASVSSMDINAVFNNQAGLAAMENYGIILDVQRRYGLADLSTIQMGIAKSTKFGTFGMMVSSYGIEDFKDQKIGVNYSRKLMDNLYLGGQLNLLSLNLAEFGTATNIGFEVGLIGRVVEGLFLSAHVTNPKSISLTEDTDLESRLRIGILYIPSKKIEIQVEIDKILDEKIALKAGIQYNVIKNLYIRVGASSQPSKVGFGFGYRVSNKLQLDASYSFHQQLGYSPGISVSWNPQS